MTKYIDMSDAELASYALSHPTAVPKLCYALAKRLEAVTKIKDEALAELREWGIKPEGAAKPNTRPASLVDLYDQKGLSVEAREWLTKHRPETWRAIQWIKHKMPGPVIVGAFNGQQCENLGIGAGLAHNLQTNPSNSTVGGVS